METLSLRAPAKINLFLSILRKRSDHYHDIFSWFQAVDLFDYLLLKPKTRPGFDLYIKGNNNLPRDENNITIKASRLLFERFGLSGGIEIRLQKNIPVGSGMAGGSSNAAATIYAINRLYDLGLSSDEMSRIGLELGSDIPFFFSSGQAEVRGRGEVITNIPLPVDYYILLVTPPMSISTADSYRRLNLDLTSAGEGIKLKRCADFADLVARIRDIGNDFEDFHLKSYSVLGEIRDILRKAGAVLVRMSGSGPTMFGLYEELPEMDNLRAQIRENWYVYLAHPITLPAWDPEKDNPSFGGRIGRGNHRSEGHFKG